MDRDALLGVVSFMIWVIATLIVLLALPVLELHNVAQTLASLGM